MNYSLDRLGIDDLRLAVREVSRHSRELRRQDLDGDRSLAVFDCGPEPWQTSCQALCRDTNPSQCTRTAALLGKKVTQRMGREVDLEERRRKGELLPRGQEQPHLQCRAELGRRNTKDWL